MKKYFYVFLLLSFFAHSQTASVNGIITNNNQPLPYATINVQPVNIFYSAGEDGKYTIPNLQYGTYRLEFSALGFSKTVKEVIIDRSSIQLDVTLSEESITMDEVVITGTMREVTRSKSPVPVEVFTPAFFKKNPTPSLFEAVGLINGVRPQVNCNVCNTGDIEINGMKGPYTLILIDGMPIVSSLSTVYGLNGIPNSLIERIEVVKGPAAALYGSEAMGGIINIITKNPVNAPLVSIDAFGTSWQEYNLDASVKYKTGKATGLLGINYFNYSNPKDNNNDNFTDVTLQDRISIFNKWNFERKDNRIASIAGRYVYEDRYGGEMNFTPRLRGSDMVYGESVYTARAELLGMYQLPVTEKIYTQFSYNWHDQNSWYGITPYKANQQVAFIQAYWDKPIQNHNLLLGSSFRYTYYDDNTPGTLSPDGFTNRATHTPLPGIYIQDEWAINDKNTLLAGYRYDHDKNHGSIHSPRFAYKLSPNQNNIIRASFGTGFRVVNLFTEDHAALTGSRQVEIVHALEPEKSYNANLNYIFKYANETFAYTFDATAFYSYFTNKIIGDFDTDPNKIIYDNIDGHAVTQGISVNNNLDFRFPLKITAGVTYMDVFSDEVDTNGIRTKIQQLFAPKWSGNFLVSYAFPYKFSIDFTGIWNGPMRLPVVPNDYRPEYSPPYWIANIQLTKKFKYGFELYGGVKNIFDFIPSQDPLLRANDPFDRTANNPVTNPNGYTFDTAYNYAPLQGARTYVGLRYILQ